MRFDGLQLGAFLGRHLRPVLDQEQNAPQHKGRDGDDHHDPEGTPRAALFVGQLLFGIGHVELSSAVRVQRSLAENSRVSGRLFVLADFVVEKNPCCGTIEIVELPRFQAP